MLFIFRPAALIARTADSRPGPGPLTKTSTLFIPNSTATVLALSAAICAANGVLLRDPKNYLIKFQALELRLVHMQLHYSY